MAQSLDRSAEGWRLTILASLGICGVLALGAAIFFLQGAAEAQSAFRRFLTIAHGEWELRDDPRGFQPYVVITMLIASAEAAALGARRVWQRQIRWAVGPLILATLGFGLCTLGAMWSSEILHPFIYHVEDFCCPIPSPARRVRLAKFALLPPG